MSPSDLGRQRNDTHSQVEAPAGGTVNLTSPGQDEASWSEDQAAVTSAHTVRPCTQHPMMNRPPQVSPHTKQVLNDAVNVQEPLRVVG